MHDKKKKKKQRPKFNKNRLSSKSLLLGGKIKEFFHVKIFFNPF